MVRKKLSLKARLVQFKVFHVSLISKKIISLLAMPVFACYWAGAGVLWEFDVIYFWFFYAKTTRHPFWYNLFLVFLVHSLRSKNTWTIFEIFFSTFREVKKKLRIFCSVDIFDVIGMRNISSFADCLRWLQRPTNINYDSVGAGLLQWNCIHLCNPDITTWQVTQLRCGANDNLSLLIRRHLLLSSDAGLRLQIRSENHYLNYYH